MVGVDGEEERRFDVQRVGQRVGDQGRVGDGHAGVDAQHFDMRDRAQLSAGFAPRRRGESISGSPPVRITSRISGWARDIGIGGLQFGFGQQAAIGADLLAAEAEAAIDRAGQQRLEQRAVRVAVDDAGDGRERLVGDRVRVLRAAR